ncbi:MAG: cold shock domain-containing protein [Anaerolineae bacterium]
MNGRVAGVVKWFNNQKGYGFITRDGDSDVFVHYSAIRGDGYRTLQQGQPVEYTLLEKPKGPAAEDVVKVDMPVLEPM